jgi:hypothetical protein
VNPHSPTDSWLKAMAGEGGYDADPEVGDEGASFIERDSGTYEVMVKKVEE